MRPLRRPAWNDEFGEFHLGGVATWAFGLYCAICERPLMSSVNTWQASTGRLIGGRAREETWDSILPLCDLCAAMVGDRPPPGGLLLPDRDVTFRLDGASPFTYERRVAVAHGPSGEAVDAVVVVGTTEEARRTIRYFNLNTSYYDEETGRFTLPTRGLAHLADSRLEFRTNAWKLAAQVTPLIRDEDPTVHAVGVRQAHLCIDGLGFWSVWATVLWSELGSPSTVVDILAPDRGAAALAEAPGAIRAVVPRRGLPGTRMDWLPDGDEVDA